MLTSIRLTKSPTLNHMDQGVIFFANPDELSSLPISEEERRYILNALFSKNKDSILWTGERFHSLFIKQGQHKDEAYVLEYARKAGAKAWEMIREWEFPKVWHAGISEQHFCAFMEGLMLSSYRFDRYKSEKKNYPCEVEVIYSQMPPLHLKELENKVNATFEARDLVNEPVSFLDAIQLGKEIQLLGKKYGFETEVFDEPEIASLKMAGLLAVNAGSKIPPSFIVLKHGPLSTDVQPPIVLVGKGIVYDTGGLSLKPTANSMDFMKSDMAGAAAVVGTFCALAGLNLPFPVIGLIPATDNRPGYNAMAPGDIITFANGKTVEILNTDAEGRLVLADALIYGKKFNPRLVIDLATLTGSAATAIGKEGAVMMGTAQEETKIKLKQSGQQAGERLVEFPLWEEYGEQLHSEMADINNLGGPTAGAITAGKFLEHFIDYEWIHIDIAGPSYNKKGESYKPAGGTGFGVRLLTQFLKNLSN